MKSTLNCGNCGAPATLICGGCGDVAYCSTKCQKSAWKSGHKSACKAYKIEIHPEYGRFLVASRQLKAGSRILTKLKPSVVGPPLTNPINTLKCPDIDELRAIMSKLDTFNQVFISCSTCLRYIPLLLNIWGPLWLST